MPRGIRKTWQKHADVPHYNPALFSLCLRCCQALRTCCSATPAGIHMQPPCVSINTGTSGCLTQTPPLERCRSAATLVHTHSHNMSCTRHNNSKTVFTLWNETAEVKLAEGRLARSCGVSWPEFSAVVFVNQQCSRAQLSCKSPELRWTACP